MNAVAKIIVTLISTNPIANTTLNVTQIPFARMKLNQFAFILHQY